ALRAVVREAQVVASAEGQELAQAEREGHVVVPRLDRARERADARGDVARLGHRGIGDVVPEPHGREDVLVLDPGLVTGDLDIEVVVEGQADRLAGRQRQLPPLDGRFLVVPPAERHQQDRHEEVHSHPQFEVSRTRQVTYNYRYVRGSSEGTATVRE